MNSRPPATLPCMDQVMSATNQLESDSEYTFCDGLGSYVIKVGDSILEDELLALQNKRIVRSPSISKELTEVSFPDEIGPAEFVVSIGSCGTHDSARRLAKECGASLITVPAPLTNDSFGTNRLSGESGTESTSSLYASRSLVDTRLLARFSRKVNLLAIGEFVGLYYSVNDYCDIGDHSVPSKLMATIVARYHDLCRPEMGYRSFLRKMACALVLKCLVMRINLDHRIGCGIDHMLANVLEPGLGLPHGRAVYLGSIIAAGLFPDWQLYGLSPESLIRNGLSIGIITVADLRAVASVDMSWLVKSAMGLRSNRQTVLQRKATLRGTAGTAVPAMMRVKSDGGNHGQH